MADDRADSLTGALAKVRIPLENHEFIKLFTAAVGVADCRAVVGWTSLASSPRAAMAGLTCTSTTVYDRITSEDEVVRCAGSNVERGLTPREREPGTSSTRRTKSVTNQTRQQAARSALNFLLSETRHQGV